MTISPPRQFSTLVAYGSGVEQGHDQPSTISLRGSDQYGVDRPVVLGTNCKLKLVQSGAGYPFRNTSSNTTSYQMPAAGSNAILVLLSPISPTGQIDTIFKRILFLVPCGTPPVTDATKCFVIWKNFVQDDISSATLFAVDINGNRRRQGGDSIQTTSIANTPTILTTSIKENLDGSYTIRLMMPVAAFASQTPAPALQIPVNGQPIQATPISFAMSPLPMVSTRADGLGLTDAIFGQEACFSISCLSSNGQLSSTGFHDASVYLLQTGTDAPAYVVCTVSSINTGTMDVRYTVPADLSAGTYQCYIFVNSEQISQSSTTVNVMTSAIDDFSEAYEITQYKLTSTPEQRSVVANPTFWTINTSQDDVTTITTQNGAATGASAPINFALNLTMTDEWFQNGGFIFTFDITINSHTPIQIAPFTEPTNPVTMTWINGPINNDGVVDNTQSTIEWEVGGNPITVPRSERLHLRPTDAATICYHYIISEDKSQYLRYIFQAGQCGTQGSWPRTADLTLLPTLSLNIRRLSTTGCTIGISNVTTVPTRFRTQPRPTATADSFQFGNEAANVLDGNASTFWH